MSTQPFTIGTYKGRPYRVLWLGRTKYGFRAHLAFMNGSKDFWCDGNLVLFNPESERTTERRQPQEDDMQPIVEGPQPVDTVPPEARPVNRPYPLPVPRPIEPQYPDNSRVPTWHPTTPPANPTRQPQAYANLTQMLINAARGQKGE